MGKKSVKPLFDGSEWTFSLIKNAYDEIEKISQEELKLETYPNQIEIISSDQMIDLYSSIGMPVGYNHWSYGKRHIRDSYNYQKGHSGLAYEIVINSSPSLCYLMSDNTMTMQCLTLSHAAQGHCAFFKNNYLFQEWTDAEGIIDYLLFAKKYVKSCEEKYGIVAVEQILDAAHALQDHGVDKYRRPSKLSKEKERLKQSEKDIALEKQVNELWEKTVPIKKENVKEIKMEPEENILYFLEKYSPTLKSWQKELVRIVRKIAQYFEPQKFSKVANEGTASFYHYYIMNRLWEKGLINDGSYLEFIHSHTSVVSQPSFDSKYYGGFNVYWLGFNILMDVKRICENPTSEDKEWFPDIAGTDWLISIHDIIKNYRDESLIQQFLSPNLIREGRLFMIDNNKDKEHHSILNIHNEKGYRNVRNTLAKSYDPTFLVPEIQIVDADLLGNRVLKLKHTSRNGILLNKDTQKVLNHLHLLWGYSVRLESVDVDGKLLQTYEVK